MTDHFEKDRLYHEAIAHEYDAIVVKPRAITNELLFKQFSTLIGPGSNMLDAACGTGHMVMRFADRFANVVALDHSQAMLAEAKRKVVMRHWTNVTFIQADVFTYIRNAQAASLDLITCVGFLHHLMPADIPDTVSSLARLLSPGGMLLLSEPIKIATDRVPARVSNWNRRSLAARTCYTTRAEEPDEEPLDAALVMSSLDIANLRIRRAQRSFEVFPHNDPPSLRDRVWTWLLNKQYGHTGNVLTVAAQRVTSQWRD